VEEVGIHIIWPFSIIGILRLFGIFSRFGVLYQKNLASLVKSSLKNGLLCFSEL
jgi:hypothetical protein